MLVCLFYSCDRKTVTIFLMANNIDNIKSKYPDFKCYILLITILYYIYIILLYIVVM